MIAVRTLGGATDRVTVAGFDDEADIFTTDTLGTAARLAEVMATFDPDGRCTAASRRP